MYNNNLCMEENSIIKIIIIEQESSQEKNVN